ncbi:MAG TPA: uL15m family ribosomal protein, partial [Candidatus Acidoferrales bacterium]|nr:uL15m family ribosomal protein [Candidatus Acidoferrales bacterium]
WARRLPHRRGYSQKARDRGHFGTRFAVVNLHRLAKWDPALEITPESLRAQGFLKSIRDGVKLLGTAEALPSGLRLRHILLSKSAREALVAAGASVEEAEGVSS